MEGIVKTAQYRFFMYMHRIRYYWARVEIMLNHRLLLLVSTARSRGQEVRRHHSFFPLLSSCLAGLALDLQQDGESRVTLSAFLPSVDGHSQVEVCRHLPPTFHLANAHPPSLAPGAQLQCFCCLCLLSLSNPSKIMSNAVRKCRKRPDPRFAPRTP